MGPGTRPARAGRHAAGPLLARVSLAEPLFSVIVYRHGDSGTHHAANVQQAGGTQTVFHSAQTLRRTFLREHLRSRFGGRLSSSQVPRTLIPGSNYSE